MLKRRRGSRWRWRRGSVGIKYKLSYTMSLFVKLAMSCMLEQVVFSSLCVHEGMSDQFAT